MEPAPDPTEVRDAVLRNAQAGLPMFRTNGKTPIEPNGFKDATLDLGELVERWKERPDAGIGLPTGAESGKTAIDVDPRHGGDETLARLEAEHGALPPTAKQVTPSGGWHLIFDYEPRLRTGAGRLGPGLDVRNDGGYVVIAPSRGYRWERPLLGGTVPLPGWVLEISNRNGGPAQNVPTSGSSDIPHRMPEQIPYGRQHDHLVSLAGSMRRRGMSEAAIAAALIAENDERCERPGSHENMRKLARSAMQWEPESGVDFKPPPPPEPLDDAPSQLPYRAFKEVISNLPPEPEWLWEGYVGRGFITLSFAPFKTGKTTLLFGLLRARERGDEEFLGRKVGTGTTLLLTEEGSRTLLDKAFTFDITGEHIEVLLRNQVLDKPWEQIAEDAIRRCREQGHDLLVIDTAAPWMDLEGEKENQAGYVVAAFRPLERCRDMDISVLVKHHASKAGGAHGKAARGSGAFGAAADILVELQHVSEEDDCPRVLKVQTRLDTSKPEPLGVHYADGEFEHTTDIKSMKPNQTRNDILGLMADGATRTKKQIAEAVGKTEKTVQRYLTELVEAGELRRDGVGAGTSPYTYTRAG